jgi:PEP-CTERM motif
MKKLLFVATLGVFFVASSISAQALTLLSEDFTGVTIQDNKTINLITANTSDDNLGVWIDFPSSYRWGISEKTNGQSGDYFAQHLPQETDNTNLLFYGIDVGSLSPLASYCLDFDYVSSNRTAAVILGGMNYGDHSLDPHAPWFENGSDDGELFLGNTPGEVYIGGNNLDSVSDWTHVHLEGVIPADYDVLVLGFIMGGIDGFRGVDNIELCATAPVPEPSTMLLLGVGLVGLIGVRKKIKK